MDELTERRLLEWARDDGRAFSPGRPSTEALTHALAKGLIVLAFNPTRFALTHMGEDSLVEVPHG